ncbi:hypothetical protein [Enterococcus wangshanyuanii]|uniref:Uncharacterized protein n=1 Tax=Enterococcus wangshanyuanii TaxID=2005703 RepID=A0ABQ1PQZ2_9ENTE|nr:hypothetical protein [Enterococcus wangshanyuanii]GGD01752.1 hypothetical protein GCM10011573_34100 [Enterococcus wangshanyuanii]
MSTKPTQKEQQAMKKQAQQVLKIQGKDYDEYLYAIHKDICVESQDLILKSLENEAKRIEQEKNNKLKQEERNKLEQENRNKQNGGQTT